MEWPYKKRDKYDVAQISKGSNFGSDKKGESSKVIDLKTILTALGDSTNKVQNF